MENMQNKQEELTAGQAAVMLFDFWIKHIVDGSLPDCKRYEKEFFEFYGDRVESKQSPFYLMFCAFVGAMDLNEFIEETEGRD